MKKPFSRQGRLPVIVGVLFAAVLLYGSAAKADVNASGPDSAMPMLKALAAAYEAGSGKKINFLGGGSGPDTKSLASGDVTLTFLARELNDAEKTAGLVVRPYALEGIAVIVHKDNPVTNITLLELKDLFTGQTTNWADANPVVAFNRNPHSRTREMFQEVVLGTNAFTLAAAVKHDGILISYVSKIPSAVAYAPLAEADETLVKIVAVNGIKPAAASLKDRSYPISRTSTLATKGEAAGEEKAFIDFILGSKGQSIIAGAGLVPVP